MKRVFACAAVAATVCLVVSVSPLRAESPVMHKVKRGDTLWSLSGSYLNDPLLWPRIWKLNPGIRNPDLLAPGQMVRIPAPGESGDTGAPPAPAAPPRPAEGKAATAAEPPIDLAAAPPLSLRVIEEGRKAAGAGTPGTGEEFGARYYDRGIGMVTENIPADGRIGRTEEGWSNVASGNTIYIEAPGARVGQRFGIYRDLGKVNPPGRLWARSLGHLLADIGILEVVAIEKEKQTAVITRAFTEILEGDLLGPVTGVPVIEARVRAGAPVPIEGNVVAVHLGRELAGPDEIVYIDLGTDDGLRPGDRLAVGGSKESQMQREAGEIMILRVTPTTAAALVLPGSGHDLQVGDAVGPLF